MKQSLQLKLHQQLTLTPQLQQSIRLLQLSTLELGQEISQMLQDNPLLERLDGEDSFDGPTGEAPAEEAARKDNDEVYEEMAWGDRAVAPAPDDEDEEHGFQQAESDSLRLHLAEQLGLTPMTTRDRQLISFLIEALDDDGEPFGFGRFEDVLRAAARDGAGEIRHSLLSAVKRFTRNRPPEDDQTLVVLSMGTGEAAAEASAA
jgi:RNA polymerase sigma-54 factor